MFKSLLISLLLVALTLSQTFPPIDSRGGLQINWQNLNIDDTKLGALMTTFRSTYNIGQLKYLNIHLDMNRLSTLNGLSVLSNYNQVIEFSLGLADNQNLESVVGATLLSGNVLQHFNIDFQNDFKINDLASFGANLKNLKYIKELNLNFYGTSLSQNQHDSLIQSIGKYLYFNLQVLQLNMQGAGINNIQSWKQMTGFTSLLILKLDYQFVSALSDIQEIYKIVETYTALTNLTFYQTCQNYNYFSQLSYLSTLSLLELSFLNIDQANHDKLVNDIGSLTNLETLTLAFDSQNITNTQGLLKLKSLSYLTRFGITYKNSKIVDISGLSVVKSYKNIKQLRLAILQPSVQGISALDFLTGLKFTLLDLVIESNNLPKTYFTNIYGLTTLKELYLKIVDMSQVDGTILHGIEALTGLNALGINIDDTNIYDISNVDFTKFTNLILVDLYFGDNVMKNYYNFAGLANAKNINNIQIFGSFSNYSFLQPFNNLTRLQVLATLPYRACSLSNSFIGLFNQDQEWNCRPCNEECLKCYGPQFSECLTCLDTYWFMWQCLETCPTGYHPNPATHRCDPDSTQKFLQW